MPEELWIRFWHPTSMQNGPGVTTLYALQNAKSQNADGSLDFVPLAQWPYLFAQDPVTHEWYWEGMNPAQIPAMFNAYNARLASQGLPPLPRLGIPVVPVAPAPAPSPAPVPPAPSPVYQPAAPPQTPTSLIPPGYQEPIRIEPDTGQLSTDSGLEVHIEPGSGTVVDSNGNDAGLDRTPIPVAVSNRSLVLPLVAVSSVAGLMLVGLFRRK